MNPLVSIIVPVYNNENHIIKCIDSLLIQDYPNYEILIINDGSVDKSGEICNRYQSLNKKVKVFHIANQGVSNARNYGIEKSIGEYIQFVDADDFINEKYISSMVCALKGEKLDIVISGIKQVKMNNQIIEVIKEIKTKDSGLYTKKNLFFIMADLINSSYINYCYSKLIKKKLLIENNIRFDKNVSLGEDTLFVIDVLKHSENIFILSNAEYNYLIHSNETLTYKPRDDKFILLCNVSNKLLEFCLEEKCYSEEVKEVLDKRFLEIIKFCLDENLSLNNNQIFIKKIKNISKILKDENTCNFISEKNPIINKYPVSLIKAIESKKSIRYIIIYYSLILKRKLGGII
ncbi:glycosyltransferase family 2 protein [Peribacillus sp. NPDC097284]|uniref:glycosyltransferase family 2 protein n=1 Tax=Peribacillus sp. NPDC097284 TaxID=3364401 RepID=UPI003825F381